MGLPTVPFALAIDAVVGDPDRLWRQVGHPVTWIGAALDRLEARLNKRRRQDGVIALAALVGSFTAGAALLAAILPDGPIGFLIEAALASTLIAQKSLDEHVRAVATADDLDAARRAVGRIVGRNTAEMDEPAVSRAALETLGENWSDGVVAPVFWLAVGGLPGIVAYKAINTADSMIGHRTPRYEAFGWAAARLDDVVNFIPARLAALMITLAQPRASRRWDVIAAGGDAHVSTNAGWPETALAVALGVELGGPRRYGKRLVEGVRLNRSGRAPRRGDIARGLRIVTRAAWIHGLAYAVLALLALALFD